MEEKSTESNEKKQRSTNRKQIIEKKKIREELIKKACLIKDPLAYFPDFHLYNYQGLCLRLEGGHGTRLSRSLKQYVQNLLKVNMAQHYGNKWSTEEKAKYKEMVAPEAHYIFVYEVSTAVSNTKNKLMVPSEHRGDVVGFVHYRFVLEEELPVLYLYELQLEQRIQGKGLGKFLMQVLELIACKNSMDAIMLTVQKANSSALFFYTHKLGYCVSSISPSRCNPLVGQEKNYEILCRTFNEEAKNKLE